MLKGGERECKQVSLNHLCTESEMETLWSLHSFLPIPPQPKLPHTTQDLSYTVKNQSWRNLHFYACRGQLKEELQTHPHTSYLEPPQC